MCCICLYPSQVFRYFVVIKQVYSKPTQTSTMKVSAKIDNGLKQLNISGKSSILDVWAGSESATSMKVDTKHQFNFFWQSRDLIKASTAIIKSKSPSNQKVSWGFTNFEHTKFFFNLNVCCKASNTIFRRT